MRFIQTLHKRGTTASRAAAFPFRRNGALFFIGMVVVAFAIAVSAMALAGGRPGQPAAAGSQAVHAPKPAHPAAARSVAGPDTFGLPSRSVAEAAAYAAVRHAEHLRHLAHLEHLRHLAHLRLLTGHRADGASQTLAYIVRPGDTLSTIARRMGSSAGWAWLYDANRSRLRDPDSIYLGQVLTIPKAPSPTVRSAVTNKNASGQGQGRTGVAAVSHSHSQESAAPSGMLGCSSLETLWERAGGSPYRAKVAAAIAMAESSGEEYATGSAGERGYWQISPVHGLLSTYDPLGNARAAVILSGDGTDWSAWTTYTSGAYAGRC
jgi:LysM repeat protein